VQKNCTLLEHTAR